MKESTVLDWLVDESHGFLEVFERIRINNTYVLIAIILEKPKWTIVQVLGCGIFSWNIRIHRIFEGTR